MKSSLGRLTALLLVAIWPLYPQSLPQKLAQAAAKGSLRVAYIGTSVTCGTGASRSFLPAVNAGLQRRFQTKIQTYDLCFGGAHSFTLLLLLKHTALPWKPDLAVVETGALDGFAPSLSPPAIEQIFSELVAAGVPALFLTRTAKCSEENVRPQILQLAARYGFPVADLNTAQNLTDGCHPNDEGHARIATALLAAVDSPVTASAGASPAPFPSAAFLSASKARTAGAGSPVTAKFFRESGPALQFPPGQSEARFEFDGPIAAVLFRIGHTPKSLTYQVDGQPWKPVAIQPDWFLNYYLETALPPGHHTLRLRLEASPAGVILDGLETLSKTR